MLALIEARLDTFMWNEGFEQAATPWMSAYTTDPAVADYFKTHPTYSVRPKHDDLPQTYTIRVLALDPNFQPPATVDPTTINENYIDEVEAAERYIGLLGGTRDEQIVQIIKRLRAWDGI